MPTPTNSPESVSSRKLHSSATKRRIPSPSGQTWQTAPGVARDFNPFRILIVDDDPDVLNMVSRMVKALGYASDTAGDGMDALFHLNKTAYDLVLTDYSMPFVDGHQLADQIKRQYAGTTVIIMTGHCEETLKDMLDASDAVDGLLLKPFNLAALKEKIETADRSGTMQLTC